MRRRQFYEVPAAAHIYLSGTRGDRSPNEPEEAVRQWCAFELIRAYGFRVSQLEFERSVKVGSKTYWIDVLVLRNGTPWIVVECKQPDYSKHEKGVEQAISYADAQNIQAEFAIYTNGSTWLVRRKVQGEWVAISDLPAAILSDATVQLARILSALSDVCPLLYRIDEPLAAQEAEHYLDAMQCFFHGKNLLTEKSNEILLDAIDHLLRAVSVREAASEYRLGNLQAARRGWELYREMIGSKIRISEVDEGDRLSVAWCRLHRPLLELIDGESKPPNGDVLLLRLTLALLDYGDAATGASDQFIPLVPAIHHALRDYLNFTLTIHFNTRVPDSIDKGAVQDMKQFCKAHWDLNWNPSESQLSGPPESLTD